MAIKHLTPKILSKKELKDYEDSNINNYKKHFREELKFLKKTLKKEDSLCIQGFILKIEEITDIFSEQGHSGGSGPFYARALADTIKKYYYFNP